MYKIILLILLPFISLADDLVIEVLISSEYNDSWLPKKNLHLTLAHIKNISGADIQKTVHLFNKEYKSILDKALLPGFVVKNFNTNGFNANHHILEADEGSFNRITELNKFLYSFLNKKHNISFTGKTLPREIYDKTNPPPGKLDSRHTLNF